MLHRLSLTLVGAVAALFCFFSAGSLLATPGDWQLERLFLPDRGVFEGEEVLSMDVDIDGDGVVERLTTLRGDLPSKQGQVWRVFDRYDGRFKILGSVSFPVETCALLEQGEGDLRAGLYAYYPGSSESGSLVSFKVVGGKVLTEKVREIYPKGADKELYERLMNRRPEYRSYSAEQLYLDYPDSDAVAHVYIQEDDPVGKSRPKPRKRSNDAHPAKGEGRVDDPKDDGENGVNVGYWLLLTVVICTFLLFLGYGKRLKAR